MKTITSSRCRGSVLLAVIALVVIAGIIYIGYKLIIGVHRMHIDPNHGMGTNDVYWAPRIEQIQSEHPADHGMVTLTNLGMTVPMEALTNIWYQTVQTSTDLADWYDLDADWSEALELCRTNHNEPQRFYRRVIWW